MSHKNCRLCAVQRQGDGCQRRCRSEANRIVREPCGRRGRYNEERLMAEHGDVKLTNLLATLADCPKARSVSNYDRWKVVYEGVYCGKD